MQTQRFSHHGVQLRKFSPWDRHMVSVGPVVGTRYDPQLTIIIQNGVIGRKKREFQGESSTHWPIPTWSYEGQLDARTAQETLGIYDTLAVEQWNEKSLTIGGIKDVSWSPGENVIALGGPEDKDGPTRAALRQCPTQQAITVRNLVVTAEDKVRWQENGHFLWEEVGKPLTGRQSLVTNFRNLQKEGKAGSGGGSGKERRYNP